MFAADLSRRHIIAMALSLGATPAFAAVPPGGQLRFSVWRNGTRVGEHLMAFRRDGAAVAVTTDVDMAVKLGPVPVFRYSHEAREQWRDGAFQALETATSSNGKRQKVVAQRRGAAVDIETLEGRIAAAAQAAPLTHWNVDALSRPLFNPQTGKLLKVTASPGGRSAPPGGGGARARWTVNGEARIENWYDENEVWTGLRGRLEDGSTMEYRRI